MAFVHAADSVREQIAMEHMMSKHTSTRDPLAMSAIGLGLGALTLLTGYVLALGTIRTRLARIRK